MTLVRSHDSTFPCYCDSHTGYVAMAITCTCYFLQ